MIVNRVAHPSGATTQQQQRTAAEVTGGAPDVRAPHPDTRLDHARQRPGHPHVDSECFVEAHGEWQSCLYAIRSLILYLVQIFRAPHHEIRIAGRHYRLGIIIIQMCVKQLVFAAGLSDFCLSVLK